MFGTNPYPFTRLVNAIIKHAEKTDELFIVQSGYTPIDNNSLEVHQFIEHSKLLELMTEAKVVVTQGGFGSLQDCMRLGVKTIAVPRSKKYGEALDEQNEIVDALANEGLVIPLYDTSQFSDALAKAASMQTKASDTSELPKHLASTIRDLLGK
jgi:UDP-N-acetylglucosamine transferase subunit ALG13